MLEMKCNVFIRMQWLNRKIYDSIWLIILCYFTNYFHFAVDICPLALECVRVDECFYDYQKANFDVKFLTYWQSKMFDSKNAQSKKCFHRLLHFFRMHSINCAFFHTIFFFPFSTDQLILPCSCILIPFQRFYDDAIKKIFFSFSFLFETTPGKTKWLDWHSRNGHIWYWIYWNTQRILPSVLWAPINIFLSGLPAYFLMPLRLQF